MQVLVEPTVCWTVISVVPQTFDAESRNGRYAMRVSTVT
jgi:hypothetical protein